MWPSSVWALLNLVTQWYTTLMRLNKMLSLCLEVKKLRLFQVELRVFVEFPKDLGEVNQP
jgi:hypothetical protein